MNAKKTNPRSDITLDLPSGIRPIWSAIPKPRQSLRPKVMTRPFRGLCKCRSSRAQILLMLRFRIENVPADPNELALTVEPFCPIISQVELEASDFEDFLQKAVQFSNDHVWGNLTAHLLVDAHAEKTHSQAVERAIKDLKYGCVGKCPVTLVSSDSLV